ncbi:MAG: M23 family metallopeptidase [Puniceicoccales bacterium]|jgi:hypothetical protein|nr:M23 family metallopeptidase [Puniceicoccales bacterium]
MPTRAILALVSASLCATVITEGKTATTSRFVWPTPLRVTAATPWENIVQAAASGDPATGTFGTHRNSGTKYHEGIDIRAAARNRRGEPTDTIRAVTAGTLAHIAATPNGSYGRYVVLFHDEPGLRYYTLYAHLGSVAHGLRAGQPIPPGAPLGIMGRSDGQRGIPKERAHLHFEVGVRLNPAFERWYSRQKEFTTPNRNGAWNGINLNGTDPLPFLRAGLSRAKPPLLAALLKSEPTAVSVYMNTPRIPAFVRENPALLSSPLPTSIAGWKIDFAWHGLPFRWTPLSVPPIRTPKSKSPIVISTTADSSLLNKARVRGVLVRQKNGAHAPGTTLLRIMDILFE